MENENQGINPVQNVATTSPVVDPLAPIDPLAPAQAPVVDPNATAPEENDNKKKLLLIIIIAAVILAIILALCLLKKDNITEAEKTITYADDVIKIGVTRDQGAYSYIGINGDDLYAQPLKYKIVVYDDIEKLVEDIDSGEIKIASVPAYQAANLYNQKHSVKAFSISQENNFSIVYNENIRSENNDGTLDSTVYEATTAPYASQVPEVQIDTRTSDEKQADAIDAMSDEEKELLEKALKYYDETPEVKELKKYTEELEKEMAEETGSNNIPEPPTYEDTTDSDTDIEESSDSNNDSTIYAFDKNKANGQKICVAGEGTASEFALAKYNQFEGVSSDVEWVKTPAECVKKIKNNEINMALLPTPYSGLFSDNDSIKSFNIAEKYKIDTIVNLSLVNLEWLESNSEAFEEFTYSYIGFSGLFATELIKFYEIFPEDIDFENSNDEMYSEIIEPEILAARTSLFFSNSNDVNSSFIDGIIPDDLFYININTYFDENSTDNSDEESDESDESAKQNDDETDDSANQNED